MRGGKIQVRVLKAAPKSIFNISKRFILPLMGQAYIIECPKCQYCSKDIMMGVGFLFGSVENILETLTGHDQEQVQRLVKPKASPHALLQRLLPVPMSECHSLDNKVHLTLYNSEGDLVFQTESYCGDCQKVREYMPEDNDQENHPRSSLPQVPPRHSSL